MGKRWPKPKQTVKIEWSVSFAYAIGLITTDGCLSRDGRHITFVSKDKEQIDNFVKCLGIGHLKIGKTFSGYKGSMAYRIQLTDVYFHQFLCTIGLSPAKSLSLKKIEIPIVFFFDFLRGCLDGDGSSHSYWDPRWKSSFMFYINFCTGSPLFVNWLRVTITKLTNLHGHITKHTKKGYKNPLYQLKYGKYEAIKLVTFLYKDIQAVKLTRKYLKIKASLDIVREHKGRVFKR